MKANKIIIHHSDSKDHGTLKNFNEIKRWHTVNNGWKDIGYHYVIESVGGKYTVIPGRPETMDGAHTIGQNSQAIGICLVGNFMVNEVPEAQLMELVKLIREIRNRYGDIPVMYHRDFNATSCPGDKFPYAKLNELISAKSIDRAIAKLVKLGVISSPDYWQANAKAGQTVKGEYVEAVLIRLVERGIL